MKEIISLQEALQRPRTVTTHRWEVEVGVPREATGPMESPTVEMTAEEAVDEAVNRYIDGAPRFRQRALRRRMDNPKYKEALLDEMAVKIADCPRCAAMGVAAVFSQVGFSTTATKFGIDLSNLEEFFRILVEWIPKMIPVIEMLIKLFLTLLLVARLSSVATAQGRWTNYDGLGFRQHAEVMHGINTAGMSNAQVAALRDHDHDRYGGGHPAFLQNRKYAAAPVAAPSCPVGGCPVQTATVVSPTHMATETIWTAPAMGVDGPAVRYVSFRAPPTHVDSVYRSHSTYSAMTTSAFARQPRAFNGPVVGFVRNLIQNFRPRNMLNRMRMRRR